jgi:hypothetical protein
LVAYLPQVQTQETSRQYLTPELNRKQEQVWLHRQLMGIERRVEMLVETCVNFA